MNTTLNWMWLLHLQGYYRMDVNFLIKNIESNILSKIDPTASITIIDESHKHHSHGGYIPGKYHFKISIKSNELYSIARINAHKKIFKAIDDLMQYIHAISITIKQV